ncbi:MAG: hypothetical protein K9M57_10745, partial [Phycisphaerae bacterium]|nr:hypothetical protein [Phycisphaerae bacterium]
YDAGVNLFSAILLLLAISPIIHADYIPWDALTADSWIMSPDQIAPNMYPVNAADCNDINTSYPVSFVQAATGDKARGMNALKFIHGGQMEGHMVSQDKAGNFKITNTGDSNVFTDILLLVAIDATHLAPDFSMTLNLEGQPPYYLNQDDFAFYSSPLGRPSGFYSITTPENDPISYASQTAMVTVFGVTGVTGLPALGGTITIEYSFDSVPAPVVFSVYGYVGTDPEPSIYHTNRSLIDTHNNKKNVSTFAVTVAGDLNGDLAVDLADLAMLSQNWLIGTN